MSDNQKKMGIGILVTMLCAVAFYFLYWVKTPVYSLNIIKDSIKKHDMATFEKHVDMDTIYSKAFDDCMIAMDRIQGEDTLSNPFTLGIIQMIKPTVVSVLKQQSMEYIMGEKESQDNKITKANKMANNIREKAALDKSELKDISVISKEGDVSFVAIKIYNRQLTKDFDIKVKMTKLEDGTWKLREVTNLVDFLIACDKAKKAKLAEINKPIVEELKNALLTNCQMKLKNDGNPYFTSYWLACEFSFKNNSTKDISGFYSNVSVVNKNGKVLKTKGLKYTSETIKSGMSEELFYKADLNQFISNEKLIIDNPYDKKLVVDVYEIRYTDGKVVRLINELP